MSPAGPPPIAVALTGDTAALDAALRQAEAKVTNLGAELDSGGGHAVSAAGGMNKLERGLESLAVTALGVDPHLGHIAGTIASMGMEGPIMVGFLTALAAGAVAVEYFGKKSREAREETDKLIEKLAEAARLRVGASIPGQEKTKGELEDALSRALFRRTQAQEAAAGGQGGILGAIFDPFLQGDVDKAEQAVIDATTALHEHNKALEDTIALRQHLDPGLTTDWAKKEGDSARELTRLYGELNKAKAGIPTTADVLAASGRADWRELGVGSRRSVLPLVGDMTRKTKDGRLDFGAAGRSLEDSALQHRREQLDAATGSLSNAGQVAVAAFGSMAQAAISGSNQMLGAVTGALQSIVANIKTGAGGLFGSTLVGGLVGAGIGIVGALLGRHHEPAPVRVSNAGEIAKHIADAVSTRPIQVKATFITPEGRTVEETEMVLLNRESRDGVPRYTGAGR